MIDPKGIGRFCADERMEPATHGQDSVYCGVEYVRGVGVREFRACHHLTHPCHCISQWNHKNVRTPTLEHRYGNVESNDGEVKTLADVMLPIFDIPEHVVAGVGRDNLMGKIRNDVAKCSERVGNQEMSHKRKFEPTLPKYAPGPQQISFARPTWKRIAKSCGPRYVKMFLEVLRASFDVVVIDPNPNADAMNREFCLHSDCILVRGVRARSARTSFSSSTTHITHSCHLHYSSCVSLSHITYIHKWQCNSKITKYLILHLLISLIRVTYTTHPVSLSHHIHSLMTMQLEDYEILTALRARTQVPTFPFSHKIIQEPDPSSHDRLPKIARARNISVRLLTNVFFWKSRAYKHIAIWH